MKNKNCKGIYQNLKKKKKKKLTVDLLCNWNEPFSVIKSCTGFDKSFFSCYVLHFYKFKFVPQMMQNTNKQKQIPQIPKKIERKDERTKQNRAKTKREDNIKTEKSPRQL